LLTITGGLDTALDLNYFLGCLVDDLWASELKTSPGVPAYFDNRNTTLLQTVDLPVHDLDRFFNEVEFVANLDFIQRYSKRFISHAFLQLRDVKHTVNSGQFL
nr:hypothetical protein [Tanacetum cinerariifolium]